MVVVKRLNTSPLLEHKYHSINLKQCSMFDCMSKAAAAANVTSSVQPPGLDADGICQTKNQVKSR